MNIEAFIDYIISEYEMAHSDKNDIDIDHFWKEVMSYFSEDMLGSPVNKKSAARILYAFSKIVLKLPNLDWIRAKKLRDIYECRVCAEAIAQMYERGIIDGVGPCIFGINDTMKAEELRMAVDKMVQINTNIIWSL